MLEGLKNEKRARDVLSQAMHLVEQIDAATMFNDSEESGGDIEIVSGGEDD